MVSVSEKGEGLVSTASATQPPHRVLSVGAQTGHPRGRAGRLGGGAVWLHEEVALGVTEGGVLEADGGAARPGRGVSGRREVDEAWGVQRGVGCRAGRGSGSTAGLRCNCFGGQVEWTHPRAGAGGTGLGSPHPTAPCPHLKLTVRAGPALPALSADAGEGVAAAHAGAPVHAGVGQAAVVLSCEGHRGGRGPVCLALDRWVSPPRPGPARGGLPDGGGGGGVDTPVFRGLGASSPVLQVLPFQPGGQAQRKVSPLS